MKAKNLGNNEPRVPCHCTIEHDYNKLFSDTQIHPPIPQATKFCFSTESKTQFSNFYNNQIHNHNTYKECLNDEQFPKLSQTQFSNTQHQNTWAQQQHVFCYKIKEIKAKKREACEEDYLNYFSRWSSTHISIWYRMNLQQFSSMLLFIELHCRNEHVNLIRKLAYKLNKEAGLWLVTSAVLKNRIKCSLK